MRQLLFAGLVALMTSPFVGCCATSSCLTTGAAPGCGAPGGLTAGYGPGCATAGIGPACGAPGVTAGLPGLPGLPSVAPQQQCDANCDAALQQGYLHGFSFGSAVSCGVRQALAIPLAAATFVGGTAEALLGGIGTLGSCSLAQTTSTVSAGCGSYADAACTCDDCVSGPGVDIQTPLQVIPTYPSVQPSVQGCAPCATGSAGLNQLPMQAAPMQTLPMQPLPMQSVPMQSIPMVPSTTPLPTIQGSLPLAPPALPLGVPLPRDARTPSQSTTYLNPNTGAVMATSF